LEKCNWFSKTASCSVPGG